MDQNFKNLCVVNYFLYNRVSLVLFAGTLEESRRFVTDKLGHLQQDLSGGDNVSTIEILDLSKGYYHSEEPSGELTAMVENNELSEFCFVNSEELFAGSDQLEDGDYYFPNSGSVVESYKFDTNEIAESLYPTM